MLFGKRALGLVLRDEEERGGYPTRSSTFICGAMRPLRDEGLGRGNREEGGWGKLNYFSIFRRRLAPSFVIRLQLFPSLVAADDGIKCCSIFIFRLLSSGGDWNWTSETVWRLAKFDFEFFIAARLFNSLAPMERRSEW